MQRTLDAARRTVRTQVSRLGRRLAGPTPERGDVPGWVLVTLMTAGLVIALWAVAGPALTAAFRNAISSVGAP
ncbi:hypothetical protein IF650_13245 [Cellulosimicrobium terreum]|nr:hypothetical protein [Cellulosimicrobium terreum]